MSDDQFEREKNYRAALSVAKAMLLGGIVIEEEYRQIAAILQQKYRPVFGGLDSENDLQSVAFRGNVCN